MCGGIQFKWLRWGVGVGVGRNKTMVTNTNTTDHYNNINKQTLQIF